MNKVILLGRITADPELKHTPNNIAVTTFTLAVSRRFSDGTDFLDCVAWKKTAEFVSSYLRKGSQIVICGSIQTRSWKDKNGSNRKTVEIVVDEVYFADSKKAENHTTPAEDFTPINSDEELPF